MRLSRITDPVQKTNTRLAISHPTVAASAPTAALRGRTWPDGTRTISRKSVAKSSIGGRTSSETRLVHPVTAGGPPSISDWTNGPTTTAPARSSVPITITVVYVEILRHSPLSLRKRQIALSELCTPRTNTTAVTRKTSRPKTPSARAFRENWAMLSSTSSETAGTSSSTIEFWLSAMTESKAPKADRSATTTAVNGTSAKSVLKASPAARPAHASRPNRAVARLAIESVD